MKNITIRNYRSPVGMIIMGEFAGKLCLCDWKYRAKRDIIDKRILEGLEAVYKEGNSSLIDSAINQLEEYFNSERKEFSIPLLPVGTDFQLRVWEELQKVEFGSTASYSELTERLGDPNAIRAVASANGSNALSIFVPCHRIIGSDGDLTGYAGGLATKKKILKLEGALPDHGQLEIFA